MNISILSIEEENYYNCNSVSCNSSMRVFFDNGYDTIKILTASTATDLEVTLLYMVKDVSALVIYSKDSGFIERHKHIFETAENGKSLLFNGVEVFVTDTLDKDILKANLLKRLHKLKKSQHSSVVIKTFGLTREELQERLYPLVKDTKGVKFSFYETNLDASVKIYYSLAIDKIAIDEIRNSAMRQLAGYVYACSDISLAEAVCASLKMRGKTLSLAESFTGGAIAKAIVQIEGASKILAESIVAYSNGSKMSRLGVERNIIHNYSAVSVETVYEMGVNSLMQCGTDFVIASTGYASPSVDDGIEGGEFYLAIGSLKGIDINKFKVKGTREEVMEYGVNHALFCLYKKIREDDFNRYNA